MTDHRAHNHPDQAVDHWLTQHQHALTNALGDILDTEAGLREILVDSRHDTAVDDLDTVLDVEAGLAAILPPTSESADPPSTHGTFQDHTGAQELLLFLSPADRMALRNHPHVKEASHARDRAYVLTCGLDRNLARNLARARDLVSVLDLDRARARARARDLTRDLASARDLARMLDLDLALDLNRELDCVRTHALNLARALDRARPRARPRALDLDLARACALDLTRALDLARACALDLTRIVLDSHAAKVRRAIGLALRREPPEIDEESLHTLLDDFTTADLSDADLTGVDLSGVHWSEHGTQWPAALDVEDLKTRSDEAPPGSGTWIVRSGTATIRDLAEL